MANALPKKICFICGEDCSNRPRAWDEQGRFHCKTCFVQAGKHLKLNKVFQPPAERPTQVSVGKLAPQPMNAANARGAAVGAPQPRTTGAIEGEHCPACGRNIAAGAMLCMSCGYDMRTGEHVDVREARANAPLPPRDRSAWFMAPVYLLLRPSRFFRQFVVESAPVLTAFFAWMYGMATVIDRIDSRAAMSQFSNKPSMIPDDWLTQWAIIAIGGVLAGLLYSALGGWWYRIRLRWCSVPKPDKPMVRRVYLTSSVVFALPAVIWRGVQTGLYAKPSFVMNADPGVVDLLVMGTLFLSVWISYVGARTVFGAAKWRAVLLFLALPGLLYALVIGAVAVTTFLLASAAPAIAAPRMHGAPTFLFSYPSNWDIDTTDSMFDPAADVYVISPQNAAFHVMAYDAEGEAEDHLTWSFTGMRAALMHSREDGRFTEWAGMHGVGRVLRGEYQGQSSTIRMFVAEVRPGAFIEITESWEDNDQAKVEPGFALIRSTFRRR